MEETAKKTKTMAIIVLAEPNNFVGDESERPNVESWYEFGVRYDIAYNVPVPVSVALAEQMKTAGRIKTYTTFEQEVE